jgi:hypothetical protein
MLRCWLPTNKSEAPQATSVVKADNDVAITGLCGLTGKWRRDVELLRQALSFAPDDARSWYCLRERCRELDQRGRRCIECPALATSP